MLQFSGLQRMKELQDRILISRGTNRDKSFDTMVKHQSDKLSQHTNIFVSLPEMAGMSAPTQITMQAPSKTKISKIVFVLLRFSMNFFKGECGIFLFEEPGFRYVESSSSDA